MKQILKRWQLATSLLLLSIFIVTSIFPQGVFAGRNNQGMIRTNMSFSGMMELFMNAITSIMKQGKMDVSDYPKVEKELMYYFHRALESGAE